LVPSIENGVRPKASETSRQERRPRICMPSLRGFANNAFRCGLYEAQDVLSEIDDVDLICLAPDRGLQLKAKWQRRLLYHDVSRRLVFANPGLQRVRLTQEYDLFVAICQDCWDLPYINAIEGWKEQCKTSVCWLDEIWATSIPDCKYLLHALNRFDHVFVGCRDSVGPLSRAIGQSCHWLPGGVDAVRFNPYPNASARVIDVYGIGRRCEGIHRSLLQAAERGDIFYVYDTFHAADTPVYDHRQHRDLYANVAKRSRCFLVAPAKTDDPATQGQMEVGYRYYEGAAAGGVMIGQSPDCTAFRELFQWPDAVIQVQPDGSDILEVLADLTAEPGRIPTISRRNTAEATLRHDWVYRWKELFRVTGLEPPPQMAARERRLTQLAGLTAAAEDDPAHIRAAQH
jgi:Glycosyl transferases group 1